MKKQKMKNMFLFFLGFRSSASLRSHVHLQASFPARVFTHNYPQERPWAELLLFAAGISPCSVSYSFGSHMFVGVT
jgi:hypothetical protein